MPIKTIRLDLSRFRNPEEMFSFLQSQDIYSIIELTPNLSRPLLEICLQHFPRNLYLKLDVAFALEELKTLVPLIAEKTNFMPNEVHFSELLPLYPNNIYLSLDESQGLFFRKEDVRHAVIEAHPFAASAFVIDLINHLKDQVFYFHEATPLDTIQAVLPAVDIKYLLNRKISLEGQRAQIQHLRPKSSWVHFFQYPLEIMQNLLPLLRAGCKFEVYATDLDYLNALVTYLQRGVIYSPMSSIPLEHVKESLKHLKPGTLFEPAADLSPEHYQSLCETYASLQAQKSTETRLGGQKNKGNDANGPNRKKVKFADTHSIERFFKCNDDSHSSSSSSLSPSSNA